MFFRIFISLAVLLGAYIIYDTVGVAIAKHNAVQVEDGYVTAADGADLTVVEFVDYGCVHCQEIYPILMRAVERDKKIRLIVKPIPSLQGDNGTQAALLAYAAGRQGKFVEAHKALIENFRPIDSNYISNFALQVGLDTEQLEADMADPDLIKQPQDNIKTLAGLKAQSLPTFLVGDQVLFQVRDEMPNSDELVSLFNYARTL